MKALIVMLVGALAMAGTIGSGLLARADVTNSCTTAACTNVQDGSNRSNGTQSGTGKSGAAVGGQVTGVVSAGATSVDARNTSENSDVTTGAARGNNTASTFTGLNASGSTTVADVNRIGQAVNVQNGDNRATENQTANATTGDGVVGQITGVVTATGATASVVVANKTTNSSVDTGDASAANDLGAFVGLNVNTSPTTGTLITDVLNVGTATNVQDGANRLTGRQLATSHSGDGIAGQVNGVVAGGRTSLDANNVTDNSSVDTGNTRATNDAGEFVGLNDSATTTIADIINVPTGVNLQNGDNRREITQNADATSGDAVAGEVSGVVTSAGGSASVVVANTSTNIDSTSGTSNFSNNDDGFVGQNANNNGLLV